MAELRGTLIGALRPGAALPGAVRDRLGLEQKGADAVSADSERTGRTLGNVDYRII